MFVIAFYKVGNADCGDKFSNMPTRALGLVFIRKALNLQLGRFYNMLKKFREKLPICSCIAVIVSYLLIFLLSSIAVMMALH